MGRLKRKPMKKLPELKATEYELSVFRKYMSGERVTDEEKRVAFNLGKRSVEVGIRRREMLGTLSRGGDIR